MVKKPNSINQPVSALIILWRNKYFNTSATSLKTENKSLISRDETLGQPSLHRLVKSIDPVFAAPVIFLVCLESPPVSSIELDS